MNRNMLLAILVPVAAVVLLLIVIMLLQGGTAPAAHLPEGAVPLDGPGNPMALTSAEKHAYVYYDYVVYAGQTPPAVSPPHNAYVDGDSIVFNEVNQTNRVENTLGISPPEVPFDISSYAAKGEAYLRASGKTAEFCGFQYLMPEAAEIFAGVKRPSALVVFGYAGGEHDLVYDVQTGELLKYMDKKSLPSGNLLQRTISNVRYPAAEVCKGKSQDVTLGPFTMDPSWSRFLAWARENAASETMLSWWDYYWGVEVFSGADLLPVPEDEKGIMEVARFLLTDSREEAMAKLKTLGGGKIRYIMLDYSMTRKALAVSLLANGHYELPTGDAPVNGTCPAGQALCTNVSGCCETSFDNEVLSRGGYAVSSAEPNDMVYGHYTLQTTGSVCRPDIKTSAEPAMVVEDGKVASVKRTLLYLGGPGAPYGDGGTYPALIVREYANGSTGIYFIGKDCAMKRYSEVMSSGKDLLVNLGYAMRVQGGAPAPQVFIHVPGKWADSMLTELYLKDARDLEGIELVQDDETQRFYPSVKVFKVL